VVGILPQQTPESRKTTTPPHGAGRIKILNNHSATRRWSEFKNNQIATRRPDDLKI
jgi:hypothetical protein